MELAKTYDHNQVEDKISAFWEKGGFFKGKAVKGKKPFVVTLPPPNVTGSLHTGHAMYVVEDIMVRQKRMEGVPTLWLPGFDHASIAVEYLVSKQLKKEGLTKQAIGREAFLERAQEFAQTSRQQIKNQLQRLGFSLDWSREAYTMDEARSRAVKEAFQKLYQKGLVYQGEYIVNWCPGCKTAISDLENEYRDETGQLYYVKYGPITIATTRPETMFADVAVAIHPDNKKYQNLVGQLVPLPLTQRKIPVIAGFPDRGRVEVLEVGGRLWPAQGRDGPEAGRKPGVERVCHSLERNLVAPPELAGDAPVFDVSQPVKVDFLEPFGHDLGFAGLDRGQGFFRQGFGLDEPLFGNQGFGQRAAPLAMADGVLEFFNLFNQALRLEVDYRFAPTLQDRQTLKFRAAEGGQPAVEVDGPGLV